MKTNIKYTRWLSLTLPCACWALVAVTTACGDDDDQANDADTAGAAGASAGKGSGGSANAGNTSGGSANAGTAGKGTAGTSPSGGTHTEGGAVATTAGGAEAGAGGGESDQVDAGGAGGAGSDASDPLPHIINAAATGHDRFYGTTFDASGNVYAVGQITTSNDTTADIALLVAKFTPKGALDPTFGSGGLYVRNVANGTSGELFRGIVVQSNGKIVVSGTIEHAGAVDTRDRDIALVRINADGTKDTTFGTDGVVTLDLSTGIVNGTTFLADSAWGLASYADDRLVVSGGRVRDGGTDTDFALVRLSADGVPDDTFGTHGVFALDTAVTGVDHNNASPRNVTILPGTDGVLGAGYQPKPGANTSPVIYKVDDHGVLDTTFGDAGVFHQSLLDEQTECYAAVVQPLGAGGYKLVTTGYGKQLPAETTDFVSLRLTSAGIVDTTYGEQGLVRLDIGGFADNSRNLLVLPDSRIVLVGGGRHDATNVDGIVAVLGANGAPDTAFAPNGFKTFDLGGPADFFWGVALSPDKSTLAIAGIRGVGNAPMPASAADDAALLLLPAP